MPNQTTPISIKSFLGDNSIKALEIPIFQRKYSWGETQFTEFVDDLETIVASDQELNHFIGLLVLCKVEENGKYLVIDGQQRLTTLSIFLSAIRDKIYDLLNHPDSISPDLQMSSSAVYTNIDECIFHNDSIKLSTKNEEKYENDFLVILLSSLAKINNWRHADIDLRTINEVKTNYANQQDDQKSLSDLKLDLLSSNPPFDQRTAKNKSSLKAFKFINDHISMLIADKSKSASLDILVKFANSILNRVKFLDFVASSESEAFYLFETLNSRGIDVAAIDLVKNLFLKESENHIEDVFSQWTNIFVSNLEGISSIAFIRYSHNSRREFITKGQLYKSYKDLIKDKPYSPDIEIALADLKIDSEIYANIENLAINPIRQTDKHKEFARSIRLLAMSKTKQWISSGLALWRVAQSFKEDNSVILELCVLSDHLYRLVSFVALNDMPANKLERFLPEIAVSLNEMENSEKAKIKVRGAVEKCKVHLRELASGIEELRNVVTDNGKAAIILRRILIDALPHEVELSQDYTLEHVLPQNPQNENDWLQIGYESREELNDSKFRLGNFLLINRSLNSRGNNYSWQSKKSSFKEARIVDHIKSGEYSFYEIDEWNRSVIEHRSLWIQSWLRQYFSL